MSERQYNKSQIEDEKAEVNELRQQALKEEFSNAPTAVENYKPGDKLTRNNFISFLIFSFAISRGKVEVQIDYMRWVAHKQGLDIRKILLDFARAGGWVSLSKTERELFHDSYDKVSKHGESEVSAYSIDAQFSGQLIKLIESLDSENAVDEKIYELDSYSDFSNFANLKIKSIQEAKDKKYE